MELEFLFFIDFKILSAFRNLHLLNSVTKSCSMWQLFRGGGFLPSENIPKDRICGLNLIQIMLAEVGK